MDLLQVMAPKRQNQHDSLHKFNITVLTGRLPLLLDVCKPTRGLLVQKLKSTISWELWTQRWHHCYKMTLNYPKRQGMYHMLLWVSTHVIFCFSTKTIQRRRETLRLKSSNQLKATFENLEPYIIEIRERFPTMGQRQMRTLLLQDYAMKVNEWVC